MEKSPDKDRRKKERILPGATAVDGLVGFVGRYEREDDVPSGIDNLSWFIRACREVIGGLERTKPKHWEFQAGLLELRVEEALTRIEKITNRIAD
ncbi:MAG: hypothetical protein ABIH35_02535 [Patescibacteria group bacterium]